MSVAIRPLHLVLLLIVISIWAFNFVVNKLAVAELPPMLYIAARFVLVAAILLPFVPPPRGRWRQVATLSFTLGCLHFALILTGLRLVPASTVALITQLQVPFAAILAAVFLHDRLGWRRQLGMVLAFGGVGMVVGMPNLDAPWWAELLVVGSSFFWALAAIQIKWLGGAVSGNTINAWTAFLAVPQLVLASWFLEGDEWHSVLEISWLATGALAYNALAVVVVGYGVWYHLLKTYDVNQTMPFTLLILPLALLFAGLVLDEPLTWWLAGGGLMTVTGVGIIVLRRPRHAGPETTRA